MNAKHRFQHVTVLRSDGTPVTYLNVKHTITRNGWLELHMGEHDRDREVIKYPVSIVDHIRITEVLPAEQSPKK